MSYEGYVEYLCEGGHYTSRDAYENTPKECNVCKSMFVWGHSVDQTNGIEKDNPDTFSAKLVEIGYDDIPNQDHHGNVYYTKIIRYKIPTKIGYKIK